MANSFQIFVSSKASGAPVQAFAKRRLLSYLGYVLAAFFISEFFSMIFNGISRTNMLHNIETLKLTLTTQLDTTTCPVDFAGTEINDTFSGPAEFVLYRAIGNDLPPRHAVGQSYNNVKFILEHEPELPGLERRWILNHIYNKTEEQRLIRLLESHGQKYEILHLDFQEVEDIPLHHEGFAEHDIMRRNARRFGTPLQKAMYRASMVDHLYRSKNIYVINNNGARNAALESGIKGGFKWILPWDGNCFLTAAAWKNMRETVQNRSEAKYFHVPMARLQDNAALFDKTFCPLAVEEPQLIFRNDATERFSMLQRYGRRPKVDLLLRLGIPGPWDSYVKASTPYFEEVINYTVSRDVGPVGVPVASWVARLYSGSGAQEVATKDSADLRKLARCYGVNNLLDQVDTRAAIELHKLSGEPLAVFNETVLENEKNAFRFASAQNPQLVSLVKKLDECATHSMDFPTVAHEVISGGPIPVDSKIYDKPEEVIPKSRLGPFFRNTTCLALGWYFTEKYEYAAKAAMLLSSFFLDDDTKFTPQEVVNSLFYEEEEVESSSGDTDNGPNLDVVGSMEMKDLYYFLDAVRIVGRSGVLTELEMNAIRAWFEEYANLLLHRAEGYMIGLQGSKDGYEYRAFGPRGVFYDLQLSAVGLFSGNLTLYMHYAKHAKGRLQHQFALKPSPRPFHPGNAYIGTMRLGEKVDVAMDPAFVTKQLNAWFLLAKMAKAGGYDLFSYQHEDAVAPILRSAALFNIAGYRRQYFAEMTTLPPQLKKRANTLMQKIQLSQTPSITNASLLSYYHATRIWPDLSGKIDPKFEKVGLYEAEHSGDESLGVHPFWNLGLTDRFLVSGKANPGGR
eukprot:comp21632_c0_seq1/m.30371 comp21632_c0_seq1/g.30371  ORF comp21632_c0_seq1/g.30371 comp21632_c0_seq1/m.30371 type:complete len:850 (-) comp21632_c0_seq1:307-2856(-)